MPHSGAARAGAGHARPGMPEHRAPGQVIACAQDATARIDLFSRVLLFSRAVTQPVFCRPAATPETDSNSRRWSSGSAGTSSGASRKARRARSCSSDSAST